MDIDPLYKILLVFCAMLLLIRLKIPMGWAMVAGGVALAQWAGRGWALTWADLQVALADPALWLLIVIMALIFEYGRYLSEERNAQLILRAASAWGGRHSRAVSLMALPAVIGLIPMPGGALFSAPLVAQLTRDPGLSAPWKSAVNYWFRHVWEYWWPVYPVVIVTLSIFPMPLSLFIAMQLPLSIAAAVGGYFCLVRPHIQRLSLVATGEEEPAVNAKGGRVFWPLWLVIGATLLLPPVLGLVMDVPLSVRRLVAMCLGLGVGLIGILRDSGPHAFRKFARQLRDPKAFNLIGTVAGVMVFKTMLERSSLLPAAGEQLIDSGVPLILVVALLPFIAGLVTGIAIGFAGIAFPLLIGLATSGATELAPVSTLMLGFAFGYAGMMCSPIHLCLVLTRGYFGSSLGALYRYLLPCVLFPLVTAVILYGALTRFGW